MTMTPKNVVSWLKKARVVTLTPAEGVPSLVEAVAGERIKGSWWGHPQGARIYECAVALDSSGEVLATKLVEGKVTFVHASLWPALYRVVTDPATKRTVKLDATARDLMRRVAESGMARLDHLVGPVDRKTLSKAAKTLEAGLWLHGTQVHTERGKHETVLETWERWSTPKLRAEAKKLGLDDARAILREALGEAKVSLVL